MFRWCWLVACALGACRLGFDPTTVSSDATADSVLDQHDEDGDGFVDSVDVCPHVPDPSQPDTDGDGVGDTCDPNPSTPTETIVFFDPFIVPEQGWNGTDATPSFEGDDLVVDTRAGVYRMTRSLVAEADVFELAGELGPNGSGVESVYVATVDGLGMYYCELYDGGSAKLALSYTYDGDMHPQVEEVPVQAPIANGPFMLRMSYTPPTASCTTTWPAAIQVAGGTLPPGIVPTEVKVYVRGVAIRLHYFVQIRTTP